MNWEAMGAIGEVIGAAGVIFTLAYLAVQVRQNTAAVKVSTHQNQMGVTVPVNNSIANDEKVAALIAQANVDYESLKPGEKIQLRYLYVNYYNLWHNAYWSHREKLLPNYTWILWNNGMGGVMSEQIAARKAWDEIHNMYDRDFQDHVNKVIEALQLTDEVGYGAPVVFKNVGGEELEWPAWPLLTVM